MTGTMTVSVSVSLQSSYVFLLLCLSCISLIFAQSAPTAAASPSSSYTSHSKIFDVLSFGAKGDGVSDDSQAFLAAWAAACKMRSATVEVPQEFKFLVHPLTLSGPCQPNLVLQIDGTILAPTNPDAWKSEPLQWLNLKNLQDFTIQGNGVVDGQGTAWWGWAAGYGGSKGNMPSTEPTAIRFYAANRVNVQGITIRNSPQCHLKFDSSSSIQITGITIFSPGKSLNTDGIHLQNSNDVEIQRSTVSSGDDCISIQTGCSGINIHNIVCGPGHGVSIGGLGPGGSKACVSNVTVSDSYIHDSDNGVRIKTWPGGTGLVRGVTFSNIRVRNVEMPIVIDQFYCGGSSKCKRSSSAVAIVGVTMQQITGTYSFMPVHIACSNVIPCSQLKLSGIQLQPVSYAKASPYCINAYPKSIPPTVPPLHCYMRGTHSYYSKSQSLSAQC